MKKSFLNRQGNVNKQKKDFDQRAIFTVDNL